MASKLESDFINDIHHFIGYHLHSSILLLSDYISILKNDENWSPIYEKPQIFIDIENNVFEKFINLKAFLSSNNKDEEIKKLFALKNEIRNLKIELDKYDTFAESFTKWYDETAFSPSELDTDAEYLSEIFSFLDYVQDYFSVSASNAVLSKIMSFMPMRMTREKFYSYISDSLNRFAQNISRDSFTNLIGQIKLIVYPESDDFNQNFADIGDMIKEINESWLKHLNDKDPDKAALEETIEIIDFLKEDLSEIFDYMDVLFDSLNLLIILLLSEKELDELLEDNIYIKDVYYTALKICCEDNGFETYGEAFYELAATVADALADNNGKTFKKITKTRGFKEFESFSEDTKNSYKAVVFLQDLYEESVSALEPIHEPGYAAEPIEQEERAGLISSLIEYITEHMSLYDIKIQKIKRQQVLMSLICPYSNKELQDYFEHSFFDSSSDQKAFINYHLYKIYSLYRYFEDDDELDEHMHEHGPDCDCGHDHMHD